MVRSTAIIIAIFLAGCGERINHNNSSKEILELKAQNKLLAQRIYSLEYIICQKFGEYRPVFNRGGSVIGDIQISLSKMPPNSKPYGGPVIEKIRTTAPCSVHFTEASLSFPKVGTVINGFRYIGGHPGKEESWKKN